MIRAGTNRQALRAWAAACLIFVATPVAAQELEAQKSAVVKLISQQDGKTRVGTGFIVKREPDSIYIATASHVVEGDQAPSVEFFTARNLIAAWGGEAIMQEAVAAWLTGATGTMAGFAAGIDR